jgi:hypothetical protein
MSRELYDHEIPEHIYPCALSEYAELLYDKTTTFVHRLAVHNFDDVMKLRSTFILNSSCLR